MNDDDDQEMTQEEVELLLADLASDDPESFFHRLLKDVYENELKLAGLTQEDASLEAHAAVMATCETRAELGVTKFSDPEHKQRFESSHAAHLAALSGERNFQQALLESGPEASDSLLQAEPRKPFKHHPNAGPS